MQVTFVASVQNHQVERVREYADRLRKARPDVTVTVVEGEAAKSLLNQHKLNYGPALLIDGRLEYVGVPRWSFLTERIAQVAKGLVSSRTAAPPAAATPPKPAVATPRPAPATAVPQKRDADAKPAGPA
jgi:hypothetical protein